MRAHTRKHLTNNNVTVLKDDDNGPNVPWREAFQDLFDKYTEAGVCLKGLRLREDLTQVQMAEKLGITQANLSSMERGKRPIGKGMAHRLAELFGIDYRIFL